MWGSEHHKNPESRVRTNSIVELMELDTIMKELPSEPGFLKKLTALLIFNNLELSIRCKVMKDALKKLATANVILAARFGEAKDIIHRVQEGIDRNKKVNILRTLIPEDKEEGEFTSGAKNNVIRKKESTSNNKTVFKHSSINEENQDNHATEVPMRDETSRKKSEVYTEAQHTPGEKGLSKEENAKDMSSDGNHFTSLLNPKRNTFPDITDKESKPDRTDQAKSSQRRKTEPEKLKKIKPQSLQSPMIAINKEGEVNFGFDDPKNFEYKAYLGNGLVLVSYIFKVPHANPVPDEVFKFYCTSSKTYIRKNQLPEIRDGTLFLRRSNYKEEDDDDDGNEKKNLVVFEKSQNSNAVYIKGITKEKLIQRLLRPMMDSYYDYVVILMHSTFMESSTLLKLFVNRVKMVTNYGPLSGDRKAFNKLCRLRVLRLLSKWIQHFWVDFVNDEALLSDLKNFVKNVLSPVDKNMKSALIALMKKKEQKVDDPASDESDELHHEEPETELEKFRVFPIPKIKHEGVRSSVKSVGVLNFPFSLTKKIREQSTNSKIHNTSETPEEILNRFVGRFAAISPDSIARQITFIELYLIKNIQHREFLNLSWTKESKMEESFNIIELTKWSNHMIHLFTTDIVASKDNIKARVTSFERAVLIAELHNYNGLIEVMAALMSAPVYRLKKTRDMMEPKISYKFEELKTLVSGKSNYKKLRETISHCSLPFLPFPGLIQSDLVFTDAFNKQYLDDDKLMNLRYIEQYSISVFTILVAQKSNYDITPNQEVDTILRDYPILNHEEAYEMSLLCESKVK